MKQTFLRLAFALTVAVATLVACAPQTRQPTSPRASAAPGVRYTGINRAGPEYGDDWDGWTGQTYYEWPTATNRRAEFAHFKSKGMNTIRLPISWERLQHTLSGPFDATYQARMTEYVAEATAAGFTLILDLHNYGRYATGAYNASGSQVGGYTQRVLGDGTLTFAHITDVWVRLVGLFKSNPLVVLNLMNEQHDAAGSLDSTAIFAGYQGVLNAVRAAGSTQLVLFPNTRSSDTHHWVTWAPEGGPLDSVAALKVTDPAGNMAYDMHSYNEIDTWNSDIAAVTSWARANGKRLFLSEVGSMSGSSSVPSLLAYLNANADVWLGWATWNLDPYTVSVTNLTSGKVTDTAQMSWYAPYFAGQPTTPPNPPGYPSAPIAFQKGVPFTVTAGGVTSWVYVPSTYDSSHASPASVLVWLHGCGGRSQYDVSMVSPGGAQNWISLAVGGREGSCWSGATTDGPKVLAALADLKTHFNIDPRRVVLGGYSSGGDIGYPLAFANASLFSGVLFENTGPSSAALTAANSASWKLNIAHLAHTGDTTYPIANVRASMSTLRSKGFPVTLIERSGTHWDEDSGQSGTSYDLRASLLPFMNAGWQSGQQTSTPCSFSYTMWSACQPNSTQSRQATASPAGCVGSPDALTQPCVYAPPACSYEYTPWGTCQPANTQSRVVTASTPAGCSGTPKLTQPCLYMPVDSDGDGIVDSSDACPNVKGVKTSLPATNGCLPLVVTATKTFDWGSGFCKQFYYKNNNTVPMAWKQMTIHLNDGRLRGANGVWGAKFPNPSATGTVVVTPLTAADSWVAPGALAVTVGICVDYGRSKYVATSGGLAY